MIPPSWSTKGSLRILPRRLYRLCGASVVAAQDATPTGQRISKMSLKGCHQTSPAEQRVIGCGQLDLAIWHLEFPPDFVDQI